jgi:hypothetical protein
MSVAAIKDLLDGASRELGATTRAGFFDIARDAADAIGKQREGLVDIHFSPGTAHLANVVKKQLGEKARIFTDFAKVRLRDDCVLPAAQIGIVEASEIAAADGAPPMLSWLSGQAKRDAIAVFVLGGDEGENPAATINSIATSEQELVSAVERFLETQSPDAAKAAGEQSAARIARYAHEIIGDELRALELRKQLLNDDLASARRPGGIGGSDSTNRIRTIIQKNLQDAERAFKLKYDELNRNKSGEFQQLTSGKAAQLTEAQMVHISLASKTETTETEIDAGYTDEFVTTMKRSFKSKVDSDLTYLDEVKKLTFDQINNILQADGLKKIDPANVYALEPDPQLPLQSHFHIQKKYSGEITKDGPMQYFIALRDYTGMIMVLVGILAPLTLIAASQDATPGGVLDFINQIGSTMKQVRTVLTFITAILVLVMLIYGFFDLRRRIPQKRIEEREKDLSKAKESLEQEGRRMFNDASRDWVTQLGTYIRDLSTSISGEIEQSVRAKAVQAVEQQDEKRRKVAMAQASVDARLKGVTLLERKIEPLLRRS